LKIVYNGKDGKKQAIIEALEEESIAELREQVKTTIRIQQKAQPCVDEENPSVEVLKLEFAGLELQDKWRLCDLGIGFNSVIKATIVEVF